MYEYCLGCSGSAALPVWFKACDHHTQCIPSSSIIDTGIIWPTRTSRFKEMLEKPIKLKPRWPNDEDMATQSSLSLPSVRKGAYVKGTMRIIVAMVVTMMMKSALSKNDKSEGKAVRLGLIVRAVVANEAKSEKKPMEYFLYHGLHRLRKFFRKYTIEGGDALDKEPKKLGSSKGKVEANKAKMIKKKQVKYFLCRSLHELWNYPKQVVVKEKETSKLVESSERLLPKEEVSLSSDLGENVAIKTVKLGIMKLNSSKTTELVESLARFPSMKEVSLASDLEEEVAMENLKLGSMRLTSVDTLDELAHLGKVGCASNIGKVVMQVIQLTRVNMTSKVHSEHFGSVLHSNLLTWHECKGHFKVIKQRGQNIVGNSKPSCMNQENSV
ncbi:hypothetical protein PVK06_026724 [Gossypium arboreum]|uniref:Uncharacterized protein n=1 Tax=Gossypium arboreum TaxID=29729 RepID=A0ABR0NZR1_GOSAR|nr:hypothetical protein PVK06_026724 [Gossypium arboreum]